MSLIQIRDVSEEDRAALAVAAGRRKMSMQKYLAEVLHRTARRERSIASIEAMEANLARYAGAPNLTASILADLDADRADHDARLDQATGGTA